MLGFSTKQKIEMKVHCSHSAAEKENSYKLTHEMKVAMRERVEAMRLP